jgi:hypothetical protein
MTSHGINGGDQHMQQLERTLGERIHIKEAQTAHDGEYYIIGEAHKLTAGATLYETTWYLESATAGNWFVIDSSEINQDDMILFY